MLHRFAATLIPLRLALRRRMVRLRARPDAGLNTIEWVILIAIVAGIALTVGPKIASLVIGKANSIKLN